MAKRLRLRGGQGLDALKLVDDPIPSPEHDEVVIEMRAAGLNRSEWLYINGEYIINTVDPSNVGTEGSGIVHSVGPEAIGVAVGDEVCVLPTFLPDEYGVIAEFALVPSSALSPKPRRLMFEQAAAVWMAFATAYAALVTKGGLGAEATEQVVVITAASSSVGLAAINIAAEQSATVIAVTRTAEKRHALFSAGADHVIVSDIESVTARITDITGGRGFDLAIDAVSGDMLNTLADAAAPHATIVEYGLLAGEEPRVPFQQMVVKALNITGFHITYLLQDPSMAALAREVSEQISAGRFVPTIDAVFEFDDVADAYRHLAGNGQTGKVVVTI